MDKDLGHIDVRARRTDPDTSKQAAFDFDKKQTKAQRSVLTVVNILTFYGPLTDFQIRSFWGQFWGNDKWSYTLPCKARHWAREKGLVRHSGYGDHQGRNVRVWAIGKDEDFLKEQDLCPECGRPLKPR